MEKDHSNKKDLVKKPSFFNKKSKKDKREKFGHQISETSSVTETLNPDEINEKFEKFLDDINIPADKRDILLTKSTTIKAQMMSMSLTAQKRPTSDYIELLNQILHGKLSESKICENLDVVRICLNTCPVSGIKEFNNEKNDGLNLLLSVLNIVIDFSEASVICLRCFREFANCGYGLFKLIENNKAYFYIARCLNTQNMLLMYFAVELLTILTFYCQSSYQNVMDGLFQFSKFNSYDSRFSPIIEGLKQINIENEHESLSFVCSRFINVIVNPKFVEQSSQPLDEYYRLHLRKEFVNLGVLEIYNELLCNDKLKLTHEEINKFLQEYETEEEDINLRSEGILLAFTDTTEIFRILNRCLSNTKCEKYFRSILSSLTIVREDPIRDYLFQFIDEVVAEIILQDENGFCPDPVLRKFDKITVRKFVDEGQVEELKKALDAERLKKEEYLMMLDIYRDKDKQEVKQTIISRTESIEEMETLNINTIEDETLSANTEDSLSTPVISPLSVNELITKYDSTPSSVQIKGIKISTSPKQSVSDTDTNILTNSSPISEKEIQLIDSSDIKLSKSEKSVISDSSTEDQTLLTQESLLPIIGTGVASSQTSEILQVEVDVPKNTSLTDIDSVSVSNASGKILSLNQTQNISENISTASSDILHSPLVDSGVVDLPKIGNLHELSIDISAISENVGNSDSSSIQTTETKFDLSKDSFQPVTDITVFPDTSGSSPPVTTNTVYKPLISHEQKIIGIEVPVPPGPPPPIFGGTVPVPSGPPPPIFGGTVPVPPGPPPPIFGGTVPDPPGPPPPIFGGTVPVPPGPPPPIFGGTVPVPPGPPPPIFGSTVPVPPGPPPPIFGSTVPVPPGPPPPIFGGTVPDPPGPPPPIFGGTVPVPSGPPPPIFGGTVPVPPGPPPPIFGGTVPDPPGPPPPIFGGTVPVPPGPPPPIFGGTVPVPPGPPPPIFGSTVPVPPGPPPPIFGSTVPVPPGPPPPIFGGTVPVPPCPPPPIFGGTAPLPPGPPPGNFSLAPPPPPPGGIPVAFSKPPNILQKFGLKRNVFEPQQPMKKANWNKINEKNLNENSIWLSIKEESISESILKELENSFSSKPIVEKVNSAKGLASSSKKVKELKILDGKTAQNISILLGSLRMEYGKLKQAILEINTTILSQSMIEQLLKNLPEPEQMQKISELSNSYDELSESEQFCFQLSDIKQFKPRLESILFKLKFDDKINEVKSQYYEAEMALKEIKESNFLKKIIEIVLSLGNYMNSGSRNQQSIGFEVSFLCKLSSTKDKTNNRSLIHFLAEIVMKSFFNPLDLKKELSHIENASRFSLDITNSILAEIKKDVKGIENQLKSFAPSSNVDKFFENMAPFVDTVKEQILISERFQTKMNDAFTSVSEYFSFNRVTYKMEDLFNDMAKFIAEFTNAHKMNEEKKLLEERALKTKLEKERREQQKLNKAVSPTTCEEDSGVLDNLLAALKSGDGTLTPKRRKPKFKEGRQALDNRSRSRGEFTESLNTNVIKIAS